MLKLNSHARQFIALLTLLVSFTFSHAACTKPAIGPNGNYLFTETAHQFSVEVPAKGVSVNLATDCKSATLTIGGMWKDKGLTIGAPRDEAHGIYIKMILDTTPYFGSSGVDFDSWRYEDPVEHSVYPIVLYPKTQWVGAQEPATGLTPAWGLQNTTDPSTGRRAQLVCATGDLSRFPQSLTNATFSGKFYPACIGFMRLHAGKTFIQARVYFPAKASEEMDQIYKQLERIANGYIRENK